MTLSIFALMHAPEWLAVSEPSVKSDAIVVLNGQNVKSRLEHGVALYKQGLAPRIIISGPSELEK